MPDFTVEATYRMPYCRQRTYHAATSEEACRLAIEDDDWKSELPDYECPGPTCITGIWLRQGGDRGAIAFPGNSASHGRSFP